MAYKNRTSKLTVMHFVLKKKPETWAMEELKRKSHENGNKSLKNIEYKGKIVKDGAETALALRPIADEYDLFSVGRIYAVESPHASGLTEWTELPELGVIGDMLASNHINTRAAVLLFNNKERCSSIPPKLNSNGILVDDKSMTDFLTYSLPLLELQMGVILMLTHGLCFLLQRFGVTLFICELLAGVILGPTFLGKSDFLKKVVFPKESQELIATEALFGFILYAFISAVKLDTETNRRLTRKLATITGLLSVLVPIGIGFGLFKLSYTYLNQRTSITGVLTVMVLNSFSSFSMVVHVIEDLKLPNSELGMLVRSSSFVSGGVCLVIAVAITFFLSGKVALINLAGFAAFFIVGALVFKPIMLWMIRRTPQRKPMSSSFVYLVAAMAFLSEVYFQLIHQLPGLGAYTFGVLVPAGPPLGSTLTDKFETFTYSVLMPLGVVTSVMRADLHLIFTQFEEIKLYLAIISLIFIIKLVACLVSSFYMKMPFTDSVLFAMIMTSRGTAELALYTYARDFMFVSEPVFALLIFYTLVNSTVIAMNVKRLYDPARKYAGYEARNVTSLKPKSELRVLACVHKPDNIISITRLIDAFHPSKDRPLALFALHLVKLSGQSSPVLLSHQIQKPVTNSVSHNMIISFGQYQQNNWGKVSISAFTAISPTRLMNEDISVLALDQLASIIVLPFHRKWTIHGKVEAEDDTIRSINCKVLEKCPCSVGVFFDRGKLGRQTSSPRSICVIFLGGNDDRETLSLAKRIARDSSVHLTILHFVSNGTSAIVNEDAQLDSWALEHIRQQPSQSADSYLKNIEYKQVIVNAGVDTALAIRSIADEYDLFLVGRRYGKELPQTTGLSDWIEIPELGVIGDLLACPDLNTRAAVLVVQQQRKLK